MAIQTMNTVAARIGKVRGEMLKNAILSEVLCKGGLQKKLEKNSSDTVVYRRALPPSGIDNIWINGANVDTFENGYKIIEGVTPAARTLNYVNVTSVVEQYGVLYAITDKAYDLYEDDITSDVKQQIGETVGAIREMICYGALKGSTNKFFAGGTTRGTVSQEISLNTLRKVALSLNASHAKRITGVLSSSGDYGVTSVEPAYIVYASTDMASTIRNLPGFKHTADYGSRNLVSPNEFGMVEEFRFVLSAEFAPYADSGAAVGATGLYSTTGALVDVYPMIVTGQEAWGNVMLRGADAIKETWVAPNTPSGGDPMGLRGYAGAKFYYDALILNQGFMAVVESARNALN